MELVSVARVVHENRHTVPVDLGRNGYIFLHIYKRTEFGEKSWVSISNKDNNPKSDGICSVIRLKV